MKQFRILITEKAFSEIEDAFHYIHDQSPLNADQWLGELYDKVYSLTTMPERCGFARENEFFAQELRCLRHDSHRILYTVDHDFSAVRVHTVLYGSKEDLKGDEF